jgi:mannose-6-phosphate isomerase-like protein (cupin superfamily)
MNLRDAFFRVKKYFWPRIIGEVNDHYIKIAKIKGQEIPWHNHENEDELFYIVEGELLMEIESQSSLLMRKGDLYVVKKGVNHRVSSTKECLIMLIESKTTEHTGKVKSSITKSVEQQSY